MFCRSNSYPRVRSSLTFVFKREHALLIEQRLTLCCGQRTKPEIRLSAFATARRGDLGIAFKFCLTRASRPRSRCGTRSGRRLKSRRGCWSGSSSWS
jgi:hypothetical protein